MSDWRLVGFVRVLRPAERACGHPRAAFATAQYWLWPAQISASIISPVVLALHGTRETACRSREERAWSHKGTLLVAR
jgi:hypothetical protein